MSPSNSFVRICIFSIFSAKICAPLIFLQLSFNIKADSADHKHEEGDDYAHDHSDHEDLPSWKKHWPLLLALLVLFVMLTLEYGLKYKLPFPFDLIIYASAYLLAGYNVLGLAFRKAKRFDIFNEFFLMSVATISFTKRNNMKPQNISANIIVKEIRFILMIFIVGLVFSGLTAFQLNGN